MWILIFVIESYHHMVSGTTEFTSYQNCRKAVEQLYQQKNINVKSAICVKK